MTRPYQIASFVLRTVSGDSSTPHPETSRSESNEMCGNHDLSEREINAERVSSYEVALREIQ